jgi:hypothetical protein
MQRRRMILPKVQLHHQSRRSLQLHSTSSNAIPKSKFEISSLRRTGTESDQSASKSLLSDSTMLCNLKITKIARVPLKGQMLSLKRHPSSQRSLKSNISRNAAQEVLNVKTRVVQVPGNRAAAAVPVMQRLEAGTRAELATAKEGEAAAEDSEGGGEGEVRIEADEEVEAEARPGEVSTTKA